MVVVVVGIGLVSLLFYLTCIHTYIDTYIHTHMYRIGLRMLCSRQNMNYISSSIVNIDRHHL